ncbi:acyl-CoA dehydrogenase family protein [Bradyrhizobium sp. Pear76]|uniref:acyl-CoA dehydrogenase family protein n=1 Tax=Bradyrhizobium oropedii TaxID=1571201 RepID=UPI001E6535F3|nr:acyl-CoA dehydrogenase family protein [Bradyrhizobium oropedii]MCC8961392.1 acyl-CoA dehydrogenase family protein [Bradyrhizobium oropedii]
MADIEETNKADAALRTEVRAWLDANWDGTLQPDQDKWNLSAATKAWTAKVLDAGWAVPTWPKDWFGRALSAEQADIIAEEFARVGAPGARQDKSNLAANTMLAFGGEALKRQMIPGLLKREIVQCLLYSEPAAGSDLAGVRTRAERDGEDYIINGQKVWTSGAAHADYGMLLARTDWDVPKHKGVTFFFFPMKQPGVEVRPLRQITDESHFNEVFITNARVPAANIMGGLNNGWRVLQTALAYERATMGDRPRGARISATSDDLIALARHYGRLEDTALRQDLAAVLSLRKLNALNNARAQANLEQGTSSSVMSLGKLAMSRILHEEARVRTAIVGAESLLEGPDHPFGDDANFLAFNAYFTSIGGGTDQIQRNIISERVLNLPKEIEVDRNVPFRQVRSG